MSDNETLSGPPDWRALALRLAHWVRDGQSLGEVRGLEIDDAVAAIEAADVDADEPDEFPPRVAPTVTEEMIADAMQRCNARRRDTMRAALKECAEWCDTPAEVVAEAVKRYEGSRAAWIARGRPRGKS